MDSCSCSHGSVLSVSVNEVMVHNTRVNLFETVIDVGGVCHIKLCAYKIFNFDMMPSAPLPPRSALQHHTHEHTHTPTIYSSVTSPRYKQLVR